MRTKLAAIFKTKTREQWTLLMEQKEICYAPVLRMSEALSHPQNVHRGSFIEVRRFHFGYLMNLERDPAQASVQANGQLYERGAVLDRVEEASEIVRSGTPLTDEELDLWPNRDSLEQDLTLSWFGATNRYFALAVMASRTSVCPKFSSLSAILSSHSFRCFPSAPSSAAGRTRP